MRELPLRRRAACSRPAEIPCVFPANGEIRRAVRARLHPPPLHHQATGDQRVPRVAVGCSRSRSSDPGRRSADLPSVPRLAGRSDAFHFRMAMPRRLLSRQRRSEVKVSLQTTDPLAAKVRVRLPSNALGVLVRKAEVDVARLDPDARGAHPGVFSGVPQPLARAYAAASDGSCVRRRRRGAWLGESIEAMRKQLRARTFGHSVAEAATSLLDPTSSGHTRNDGRAPLVWCESADLRSGPRWAQAATAGSVTSGPSLMGFDPSRVVSRRQTAHSSCCSSIGAPTSRTTAFRLGAEGRRRSRASTSAPGQVRPGGRKTEGRSTHPSTPASVG